MTRSAERQRRQHSNRNIKMENPTEYVKPIESTDLLACFCGGLAMVTSHEEGFRSVTYYTTHSVRCSECSMHLSAQYLTEGQAQAAWNALMLDSRTYRNRRANH